MFLEVGLPERRGKKDCQRSSCVPQPPPWPLFPVCQPRFGFSTGILRAQSPEAAHPRQVGDGQTTVNLSAFGINLPRHGSRASSPVRHSPNPPLITLQTAQDRICWEGMLNQYLKALIKCSLTSGHQVQRQIFLEEHPQLAKPNLAGNN